MVPPLTSAFTFHGPGQVMAVLESGFALLRDIQVREFTGPELAQRKVLRPAARIAGQAAAP